MKLSNQLRRRHMHLVRLRLELPLDMGLEVVKCHETLWRVRRVFKKSGLTIYKADGATRAEAIKNYYERLP